MGSTARSRRGPTPSMAEVSAPMSSDNFGARATYNAAGTSYSIYRLTTLADTQRLPYSRKLLAMQIPLPD